MTKQAPEDESGKSEQASIGSTPEAVLAQRVTDALVADGLISEIDGANIRADLANGKLDSAGWKMVLENQLEREAGEHEPK